MAEPPAPSPPGATPRAGGGVDFRVWAPRRSSVEVDIEAPSGVRRHRLDASGEGWHGGNVAGAGPGSLYRYRLDGETSVPDPASRFQPQGPHGPSEVIDPGAYDWRDEGWRGAPSRGRVIYELHVGTFSADGTWAGASTRLAALADVGVTLLEVMPVAEFAGRFGWGYDGVDLFAPYHHYGRPDDMRAFVDRAHSLGLGVILDVVYNHFGPDGNYLGELSDAFFSSAGATDWGEAINFDGEGSRHVRAFYRANVRHWIAEYHLDGLRFDATQAMHDSSRPHILAELADEARAAAGERGSSAFLVAENEPQDTRLLRPPRDGGAGLDALWNDDLHHAASVALTGVRGAYYCDYRGTAQELVSAAKHAFLFQGQHNHWQRQRRGTPTRAMPADATVAFIENHDQVANSAGGARVRLLSDDARYRAVMAYLLLGPATPMLFQGQEFGATTPFLYFADHSPDVAQDVRRGRADELAQFANLALPSIRDALPDPADPHTFERCRLRDAEREAGQSWLAFHRDLLTLRSSEQAFAAPRAGRLDGAVLATGCFVLRWFLDDPEQDRLLIINLGADLDLMPAPEPLLAPPLERAWRLIWSSEDARYGGRGSPEPETSEGWRVAGHAAVTLAPRPPAFSVGVPAPSGAS